MSKGVFDSQRTEKMTRQEEEEDIVESDDSDSPRVILQAPSAVKKYCVMFDQRMDNLEADLKNLRIYVASAVEALNEVTRSLRTQAENMHKLTTRTENMLPLLISSIRSKDEIIDRLVREHEEEKGAMARRIAELEVKIAMRSLGQPRS